MQTKQKLTTVAIMLACGSFSSQAIATLPDNAVLQFDAGVTSTYGKVTEGSYFGMDLSGDGIVKRTERTAISQNAGLAIGRAQDASGSHIGDPDGTEAPGIDNAWGFFGNTGLTYTISPTYPLTDDEEGNVTLDFSGFGVTWNGIPRIDMSNNPWEGNEPGVAILTCAVDCLEGEAYTLEYSATVPPGDPSEFGGVKYNYFLTGTIAIPPAPAVTAEDTYAPGPIANTIGSSNGRITLDDLISLGGTEDTFVTPGSLFTGYSYGEGLTDFSVTVAGASTQAVITLLAPIPAGVPDVSDTGIVGDILPIVYRKFSNGAWQTFIADSNNLIASAAATAAFLCPAVGDSAYDHTNGLVEGDECIQLTIEDNGPYDDNTALGMITDPGGVATPVVGTFDSRVSGSDGCNMSSTPIAANQRADWWIVAGFMALLGLFKLKRAKLKTH